MLQDDLLLLMLVQRLLYAPLTIDVCESKSQFFALELYLPLNLLVQIFNAFCLPLIFFLLLLKCLSLHSQSKLDLIVSLVSFLQVFLIFILFQLPQLFLNLL